jgi:hypothetical protein
MRSFAPLPTLLLLLACDGRYVLGDLHAAGSKGGTDTGQSGSGGSGGSQEPGDGGTDAGRSGAGSSGGGLDGFGGEGDAGTGASGPSDAGAGGDSANPGRRTRWAVVQTFPSTASTQTLLHLVDLSDRQAPPLQIEGQSGNYITFSTDSRRFVYRSMHAVGGTDHYLVDLSGNEPSERQLVSSSDLYSRCDWSPDSSKLACLKFDATEPELVYFEQGPSGLGPERSLGTLPPHPEGASAGSQHEIWFASDGALIASYGPNDFARVDWTSGEPSAPQPLGVGGGIVTQRARDGVRVSVRHVDTNYPLGQALVDLKLGRAELYDELISLSSTFDIGLSQEPKAEDDTGYGTFSFYAVEGIHLTRVAQEPLETELDTARIAGPHSVLMKKGDDLVLLQVASSGVTQHVVPGEYANLLSFQLDPSQRWLYVQTAERDAQHTPISSSGQHWLSRVEQGVPGDPQLIADGFTISAPSDGVFAPDGERLILPGLDSKSQGAVPFRLLDLRDPDHVTSKELNLAFSGAQPNWSPDGTFLSFIGTNPIAKSRQQLIVDALAPELPPRLLFECSSNPAALPGCPNFIVFQP